MARPERTDDDLIRDLFSRFGPVTIRKMFGGQGIYHHGLIIAVVVDGELMLKADPVSAPDFEAAGCTQWHYEQNGRSGRMPYWTLPDGAFDDPDMMEPWARKAYEAALRAPKKKEKSS